MCCEQDNGVAGPDYETEVSIGPAHATFQIRLSLLRGRLLHLMDLDPSASGISISKYQVCARLHSIEINLAKMDMTNHPGQEKEEDDKSNAIII